MNPVRSLLSDDVTWHVPAPNAIVGVYSGRDEVLAYFRRRRELAANTMRLHPAEIMVGDGDHIGALTDGTATIDDITEPSPSTGLNRSLPWRRTSGSPVNNRRIASRSLVTTAGGKPGR